MSEDTKKRASLYFNLEDPDDKKIWEHLEKRKKSQYIKRLILNDMENNIETKVDNNISTVTLIEKEEDFTAVTDSSEELEEFPDDII